MYNHPRVVRILSMRLEQKRVILERSSPTQIQLYFVDGDIEKGGTPWFPWQRLEIVQLFSNALGMRTKSVKKACDRSYVIEGTVESDRVMLDEVFEHRCNEVYETIWINPQNKKSERKQDGNAPECSSDFKLTFRPI